MKRTHSQALAGAIAVTLGIACVNANAGVMDFLFGKKDSTEASAQTSERVSPKKRSWRISEFTAIELSPREGGAAPNQQPASLNPEGLRQQLSLVRTPVEGKSQPLFFADELSELAQPLAQALSLAGPNDDVLLLSTSRRGEGLLSSPLGITGRLFVKDGELNFIVNESRKDFVNAYLGTHIKPQFDFGSRAKAGKAAIQSPGASNKRADWIALPIASTAVVPAVAAPIPAAMEPPSPAPRAAPVVAAPAAPATMPAVAPAAPVRDTAYYEEQARRLKGLKMLRDQGAISEEEYQQKRKEILSGL